jgi:hypothetical protein
MLMLFKCFKAMSRIEPSSEEFLWNVRKYLASSPGRHEDDGSTRILCKLLRMLKPVALKIGPHFVGPLTVGDAMMVLLNYYIMAALW